MKEFGSLQDKINHEVQVQIQSALKLIVELQLDKTNNNQGLLDLITELQGQVTKQTDVIEGLIKASRNNYEYSKKLKATVYINEKALNRVEEDLYVNDLFQLNKDTK